MVAAEIVSTSMFQFITTSKTSDRPLCEHLLLSLVLGGASLTWSALAHCVHCALNRYNLTLLAQVASVVACRAGPTDQHLNSYVL